MVNENKIEWWEENFEKLIDSFENKFSDLMELTYLLEAIQARQDHFSSIGEFRLRDICKKEIKIINRKLYEFNTR
jgi:hypothetical protein